MWYAVWGRENMWYGAGKICGMEQGKSGMGQEKSGMEQGKSGIL